MSVLPNSQFPIPNSPLNPMLTAPRHISTAEMEEGLPEVLASPKDIGRLEAIVIRPVEDERLRLDSVQLTPEHGVDGDRWFSSFVPKSADDRPDLRAQVSLMNARFLRQIAGQDESLSLAGDNLIVDLDLSEQNLPAGTRLTIGPEVVIEVTELPHTGCEAFQRRYGAEARAFMNNKRGMALHLRGRYARILNAGTVALHDEIRKI